MKKLNVLIVDDEEDITDILGFLVPTHIPSDVDIAKDGDEAIDKMSSTDYDVIICDFNMPRKNGGDVYRFLLNSGKKTRYVLCSSDHPSKHTVFDDKASFYGNIQKPHLSDGVKAIFEKLKSDGSLETNSVASPFNAIQIKLLMIISTLPADIFIRIAEGNFVKVYEAGSIFDETDFIKYNGKGVEFLFIAAADISLFIDKIQFRIISLLNNRGASPNLDSQMQVQNILLESFRDFGFQKELLPSVERHINDTLILIKDNKDLELLLNKLLKSQNSYLAKHSFLLSIVAVGISSQMKWHSDFICRKFVLSSLFHDIFIKDIESVEQKLQDSKAYDLDFVKHPQLAAELINSIPGLPPGTGKIIEEHHEQGEISGFPTGKLVSKTSRLSQVFSFSHLLVDTIIDDANSVNSGKKSILDKLEFLSQRSNDYKKLFLTVKTMKLFKE